MVFLLRKLVSSLLIIVCLRKRLAVEGRSIEVLVGRAFPCCFGGVEGRLREGVSLLVYKIESKFLHLDVLSGCLSG